MRNRSTWGVAESVTMLHVAGSGWGTVTGVPTASSEGRPTGARARTWLERIRDSKELLTANGLDKSAAAGPLASCGSRM